MQEKHNNLSGTGKSSMLLARLSISPQSIEHTVSTSQIKDIATGLGAAPLDTSPEDVHRALSAGLS